MDPTEILGDLLGGKGGGIFRDIFGGGQAEPAPRRESPAPTESDISRQAKELEDMIGIRRSSPGRSVPGRPAESVSRPGLERDSSPQWDAPVPGRIPRPLPDAGREERQDSEATVLLRAMILAAKADGRLTTEEQRALISRMGDSSKEAIQFLETELQRETGVRDFAWSVPIGMEARVYMISLSAISGNSPREIAWLDELAHALRIPREVREHLHRRLGLDSFDR